MTNKPRLRCTQRLPVNNDELSALETGKEEGRRARGSAFYRFHAENDEEGDRPRTTSSARCIRRSVRPTTRSKKKKEKREKENEEN